MNEGNKEHVSEMEKYARNGKNIKTEQHRKRGRGKMKQNKKEKCKLRKDEVGAECVQETRQAKGRGSREGKCIGINTHTTMTQHSETMFRNSGNMREK